MQLKKFTKNGNEAEAIWILNEPQQALLINYAIESLLARGMIHAVELSQEEYDLHNKTIQDQIAEKFLNSLEPEEMPQA